MIIITERKVDENNELVKNDLSEFLTILKIPAFVYKQNMRQKVIMIIITKRKVDGNNELVKDDLSELRTILKIPAFVYKQKGQNLHFLIFGELCDFNICRFLKIGKC